MENLLFGLFLIVGGLAVSFFICRLIGIVFPGYLIDLGKYLALLLVILIFVHYEKWFWVAIFSIITLIIFLLSKKK